MDIMKSMNAKAAPERSTSIWMLKPPSNKTLEVLNITTEENSISIDRESIGTWGEWYDSANPNPLSEG